MRTGSTQPPDNLLEGYFSLSSICVPKGVGIIVSIPHLTMGVKGSSVEVENYLHSPRTKLSSGKACPVRNPVPGV